MPIKLEENGPWKKFVSTWKTLLVPNKVTLAGKDIVACAPTGARKTQNSFKRHLSQPVSCWQLDAIDKKFLFSESVITRLCCAMANDLRSFALEEPRWVANFGQWL